MLRHEPLLFFHAPLSSRWLRTCGISSDKRKAQKWRSWRRSLPPRDTRKPSTIYRRKTDAIPWARRRRLVFRPRAVRRRWAMNSRCKGERRRQLPGRDAARWYTSSNETKNEDCAPNMRDIWDEGTISHTRWMEARERNHTQTSLSHTSQSTSTAQRFHSYHTILHEIIGLAARLTCISATTSSA